MCGFLCGLRVLLASAVLLWVLSVSVPAEQSATDHDTSRDVIVELFLRNDEPRHQTFRQAAERFARSRDGVLLHVHDLSGERHGTSAQRLAMIESANKLTKQQLPLVYCCGSVLVGGTDAADLERRLEAHLRIDVYVRAGCSRCASAKAYLWSLKCKYPAFKVRIRDLIADAEARRALNQLVTHHRKSAASVPVIHLCNQLIVGFDNAHTTGRRIEAVLNYWTVPKRTPQVSMRAPEGDVRIIATTRALVPVTLTAWALHGESNDDRTVRQETGFDRIPKDSADALDLPVPPEAISEFADTEADLGLPPLDKPYEANSEAIELPWLGQITVRELGMPVFTILVGLVDGFNPCAMWVLLFLLSILVNLEDRLRILAVASTFVFISGLAYFAFMAAWLNVFLLVGLLRPIQIALGVTAIVVGSIHIKDFFAFKKGISLSIPDSVKPTIYQRTRRIVNAENLWGALVAASVLAVFVNVVELLCTAGLPALYSEVLTLQGWPMWKNYAYLLLYNLAYMFDDALMVACVVVTLSKTKMQEHHGRWLKLVSGVAIAALGLVMLVRPDWLS